MADPAASAWADWQGHALVVGVGGIGRALLEQLPARAPGLRLWSAGRRPGNSAQHLRLDLADDGDLAALAARAAELTPLRLLICTAGLLHGEGLEPEKRLARVRRAALERSFAVNAWGPLLVLQALEAAIPRDAPAHVVSFSARVGSIGDNRLGGWYAYRAAKAAQNQLLRTVALEWRRSRPQTCLTLWHPGTVATELSAPFRGGVPPAGLLTPAASAACLLDQLERRGPDDSGSFLAWDGQPVPW